MSGTHLVVHGEDFKETPQLKRNRLASEVRFISQQFNSKVAELLEAGLDVYVHTNSTVVRNRDSLIGNVEVSYQTPRKFY
ncbi:hypothetical protein CHOED_043 [Vibrio phage CHOED]|uniref:hypothetical protein n=1 Tax=Vibrio phage CHOED TaxID=1458716 RepID=UPI00042E1E48|nr:hypothetical protein CHOED_043 [Vibrio phage CHOED]AHK11903.1 hypothetical protein CHOED_043 [Vibrio phage CHOED]